MAIRTDQWCYVERLYEGPELYDRVADPRETTNLAGRAEHADVERELRARTFRWLFETSDVLKSAFGEATVASYAKLRYADWNDYASHLTDWERRTTLDC